MTDTAAREEVTTSDDESRGVPPDRQSVRALRRVTFVRIGILAAILVIACVVAYARGWLSVDRALGWMRWLRSETSPLLAATIFVLVFSGLVAVGFPATPFLIAAGVAFGAFRGTLLNIIGGALAVTAGYWLARTVARDAATHLLGSRGRSLLARSTSFQSILRLRLLPVIPMSAISYAAGIARVHFVRFLLASVIGTLVSSWGYAYLADNLVAGAMGAQTLFQRVLIPSLILLALTIVPKIWAKKGGSDRG